MVISPKCRSRLCVSKYGPWLNLTRMSFPRRKKGRLKPKKKASMIEAAETDFEKARARQSRSISSSHFSRMVCVL
jgi:hypothetical protein